MLAVCYAGFLFPWFLLRIWNGDSKRNCGPTPAPKFQIHLDTCVLLMLLFGAAMTFATSEWHDESSRAMDENYLSILILFAATAFIIVDIFEFGTATPARVRHPHVPRS